MVDKADVVEMFQAGMSLTDIAAELDCAPKIVRAMLVEERLIQRPGRQSNATAVKEDDRKQMIKDYVENKVPAIQLIQQYRLTWNAFYHILDEEGIKYREIKQVDRMARLQRLDRAIEMYVGGARIWEIENETGIRQPVLHGELHKRSIPLRRAIQLDND
jgi:hypothetical protein